MNQRSKDMLIILLNIFFSIMFASFYLNGEDWANYYTNIFTDNGTNWFEPGFYLLFVILKTITFESFGLTILIYFLLCFYILSKGLKNIQGASIPFFYILILLCYGNTLILEQLRQFMAAIIAIYALNSFHKGNVKKSYLQILLAMSFHVSALILLVSFFLASIRSSPLFIATTAVLMLVVSSLFIMPDLFLPILQIFPALLLKLNQYREITAIGFHLGPSFLISSAFVIFLLLNSGLLSTTVNSDEGFLFRQMFFGVMIFLVGLYIPFASRFSVYYILYIFIFSSKKRSFYSFIRVIPKSTAVYSLVLLMFVFSNLISYYKNDLSPISFLQVNTNFVEFMTGNINFDEKVFDIYLKNYENLEKYKDSQGI